MGTSKNAVKPKIRKTEFTGSKNKVFKKLQSYSETSALDVKFNVNEWPTSINGSWRSSSINRSSGQANIDWTSSSFLRNLMSSKWGMNAITGMTKMPDMENVGALRPKILRCVQGKPISSHVSLRAVYTISTSSSSDFPPGRHTSPLCELTFSDLCVIRT